MPLTLTWQQIALRLTLALIASLIIGLNRDEQGHPAGMRTTILVCLAATLAMLQVNLLLPMTGKTPASFAVMDLMRNPLGILTGVGFIGAGVIMKRKGTMITGVTTAATLWFVTVLGLLFGGGQLRLGIAGAVIAIIVLWGLKYVEAFLPREHHGTLSLALTAGALTEDDLRRELFNAGFGISKWKAGYDPASALTTLHCELKWRERAQRTPHTPAPISALCTRPGILTLTWDE